MKKQILFCSALASVLLLGSCSQSETPVVSPTDASEPIAFSTFIPSTRVSNRTITTIQDVDGFGVIAVEHAGDWSTVADADKVPNFMYEQAVTWNGSAYTYTPAKYWPKNSDQVSFFAYSPQTSAELVASANTLAANPTLTYTVSPDVDAQIDLVTAQSLDRTSEKTYAGLGSGDGKGSVFLDFKHRLARLEFAAKLNREYEEGTTLYITSLKFADVNGVLKNEGTFDLSAETWSLGASTFAAQGFDLADLQPVACTITDHANFTSITDDSKYLMLLPQVYNTDDLKVQITYELKYKDPADASAPEKVIVSSTAKTISLPIIEEATVNVGWKSGHAYKYTFELGAVGNEITVGTPVVEAWADAAAATTVNY